MDELTPNQAHVATVRTLLHVHRDDPDRYWPVLLEFVIHDVDTLHQVHTGECSRTGCRSCQQLANLLGTLAAHEDIQPAGCSCADHITYPQRATVDSR